MKTVHVNLGERSYDILIAPGLMERAGEVFQKAGIGKRIFLVCVPNLFELHGKRLMEHLGGSGFQVTEILIADGEKNKNLETVENIYTYLIAQRAERSSTLIALGGGVTGDIVGFVAATFLRGVPYVQIPTTLVSQVDSSVGGKTGVNHHLGKNMIGAFYQPHLVYVDLDTLKSLPDREFQSGLYEVLKYGLIYDLEFFEYFETHLDEILARDPAALETIISRCCEIKAEITSLDEKENDLRRILNFGHTVGHALEAATGFQGLTHGEAVAYGMIAAVRLSHLKTGLDAGACERIVHCIQRVGDLPAVDNLPLEAILQAMDKDKKRQEGHLLFVLLKEIGKTTIESGLDGQVPAVWSWVTSQARHVPK